MENNYYDFRTFKKYCDICDCYTINIKQHKVGIRHKELTKYPKKYVVNYYSNGDKFPVCKRLFKNTDKVYFKKEYLKSFEPKNKSQIVL